MAGSENTTTRRVRDLERTTIERLQKYLEERCGLASTQAGAVCQYVFSCWHGSSVTPQTVRRGKLIIHDFAAASFLRESQ